MTWRSFNPWLMAVLLIILIRLVSLGAYPLTDTTEARYGEIARVMVTSGNWVMPQLEPGVPFWAKPPLSFWETAASMSLFGVSEFSARLPSLLNMILVLGFLYAMAGATQGPQVASMSIFIVMTTVVGFITAGAVLTDMAMMLATTLAMVSFWWALERGERRWGYVFFVALALGLLAKGPVSWVLTAAPLTIWLTMERRWRDALRVIPVIEGAAILGLTALPWFLLAEIETPGFLHYYFVGEHIQRYLDSGWEGDRYGTAHDEPRGTIWLFALLAFAPWSLVAVLKLAGLVRSSGVRNAVVNLSSLQRYLLLWSLWPVVFFSLAGNILHTYVLPALPAFALLLAMALRESRLRGWLMGIALILPVAMGLAIPLGLDKSLEARSQASMIAEVRRTYPEAPLIYVGRAPHSARFYSQGTALFATEQEPLEGWLDTLEQAVLVVRNGQMPLVLKKGSTMVEIMHRDRDTAYLYTHPVSPDTHEPEVPSEELSQVLLQ